MTLPPPLPPAPAAPPSPPASAAAPAAVPPTDATGLYGLAGLAIFSLGVTAVIYLFCASPNLFIQTTFLPHFFRFGFYGEILLLGLGVYAGYRHVARLTLRHRILRALWIALMFGSLAAQYQLQLLWLMH